jgi:hypothetical protein
VSNGLLPPGTPAIIRLRGRRISATDGPYVETKEQLGGYYLIKAKRSERPSSHAYIVDWSCP